MFTGIVEACVPVLAVEPRGSGLRVRLSAPAPWREDVPTLGESVAVSGCCLSVAAFAPPGEAPRGEGGPPGTPGRPGEDLLFDLSAETLERTWFRALEPGRRVNLERSLRLGDRLGGHLVSGHVDGGGEVAAIEDSGDGGRLFTFRVDPGLERWLVEKGSVALDGISLTVVRPEGRTFRVAVIPVTLEHTHLGAARPGDRLNVEADAIGKWVERLFPGASPWGAAGGASGSAHGEAGADAGGA